jgi:hypothetical protein
MKETTVKRIEVSANLAIVIIAVLVGTTFIKTRLENRPGLTRAVRGVLTPGSQISLNGVNWKSSGQTLLLVLSAGCHFCSQSADFYKRLVSRTTENSKTKLIAVLPQDIDTAKRYLGQLGLPIQTILSLPPSSVGATGTPTLILVDKQGRVKNSWLGLLSVAQQSEILNELAGP